MGPGRAWPRSPGLRESPAATPRSRRPARRPPPPRRPPRPPGCPPPRPRRRAGRWRRRCRASGGRRTATRAARAPGRGPGGPRPRRCRTATGSERGSAARRRGRGGGHPGGRGGRRGGGGRRAGRRDRGVAAGDPRSPGERGHARPGPILAVPGGCPGPGRGVRPRPRRRVRAVHRAHRPVRRARVHHRAGGAPWRDRDGAEPPRPGHRGPPVPAAGVGGRTMTTIDVVLVDDHLMFRAGVRASLDDSVNVLGEADDVDAAITLVRSLQPPVVVPDVHLPGGMGGGGAEVITACADLLGTVRFLALSVSDAAEDVVAVIRAGARGYVTKAISGADLSDAIHRVAGGDAVFSPRLAGFVLDAFGAAAGDIATGDDELDRLSAREREVMRLIARGYSYREVASELFISIKTVETHVSAVLRKLQLSSRHELTRWAAARRLL